MSKVAWLGTGVMGASMARHLKEKGYEVSAYNRTYAKAAALEQFGICACPTIAAAVSDADYVFSMVGYPKDVEEIYLGNGGVFDSVTKKGAIAVDMTTSSPELAQRLYAEGKKRGISVLDAPVSGGDKGAKNATLSIMTGGDKEAYDKMLPLLASLGTSINYMGGAGCGQHTKMCNQICVAGATAAYTEALAYAQSVGLDGEKMLAAIAGGAAGSWQISNMAPRALKGDFAPGFFVKHFIKDMRIASDEMKAHGKELPMLEAVLAQYEKMAENGMENDGTQALIKLYCPDFLPKS